MRKGENEVNFTIAESSSLSGEALLKSHNVASQDKLVGIYFPPGAYDGQWIQIKNSLSSEDTPRDFYKPDGNLLGVEIIQGAFVGIDSTGLEALKYVTLQSLDGAGGLPVVESANRTIQLIISDNF